MNIFKVLRLRRRDGLALTTMIAPGDQGFDLILVSSKRVREQHRRVKFYRTVKSVKVHIAVMLLAVGILVVIPAMSLLQIEVADAALTPPSTPTLLPCGTRDISDITVASSPLPSNPVNTISPTMSVSQFHILYGETSAEDMMYVLNGRVIQIYDMATFTLQSSFNMDDLPTGVNPSTFALDPDGNVYVTAQLNGFYKFDSAGTLLWNHSATGPLDYGAFGWVDNNGNFMVGSVPRGESRSQVYNAAGVAQPTSAIYSTGNVTQDRVTGDVLTMNSNTYIRYSNSGVREFYMGTDLGPSDSGPFHFYQPGAAVQMADGTVYITDHGLGIHSYTSEGILRGIAKEGTTASGGYIGNLTQSSYAEYYNNRLYYVTGTPFSGNQNISWVSIANLEAGINYPQGSPFKLGMGAGAYTTAAANYFKAGTTPDVRLSFYPWWSQMSSGSAVSAKYTIRNIYDAARGVEATEQTLNIPAVMTQKTDVSLALPTTDPGYYEVNTKLYKDGEIVGADCLYFSIGAPLQTFADRPAGSGDIGLVKEYGLKLLRADFQLDRYLTTSDPASTAPLDFSSVDASIQAASAYAEANGLTLEIQIAAGSAKELALVSTGNWARRVTETVNHFKQYVRAWEPWNEPNNTCSCSGTSFSNNILEPFTAAVSAADPTATIVAGGILGTEHGDGQYFDLIGAAGGFTGVDAIGFHPYTGHNRSFEEQDALAAINRLKTVILPRYNAQNLELWDTESGFWSAAPANNTPKQSASFFNQGDKIVRKTILENSVGIDKYYNFMPSGSFENWSIYDDYLKPAGLTMVNFKKMMAGRTFESWVETGIPNTHAALYSTSAGSTNKMLVVWAEDFDTDIQVTLPGQTIVGVTEQYGKTTTIVPAYGGVFNQRINGSVNYIPVPAGVTPTITAVEDFGTNLARASQGTTATATTATTKNTAAKAIDGTINAGNLGNVADGSGMSMWIQAPSDAAPELTLTFSEPKTINRVRIASSGISSVLTGLRSFDVMGRNGSGTWTVLATVRDNFMNNMHLLSFAGRELTQIKISNISVNYSGYAGGARPSWWPSDSGSLSDQTGPWYGQATVYEFEAYAPGTVHALPSPPTEPALPTTQPTTSSAARRSRSSSASSTTSTTSDSADTEEPPTEQKEKDVNITVEAASKPTAPPVKPNRLPVILAVALSVLGVATGASVSVWLRRRRHAGLWRSFDSDLAAYRGSPDIPAPPPATSQPIETSVATPHRNPVTEIASAIEPVTTEAIPNTQLVADKPPVIESPTVHTPAANLSAGTIVQPQMQSATTASPSSHVAVPLHT